MAKKKVYAVRRGRQTGIFYTWDACKAAVAGFSGAVYKSFLTEEEARAYLAGDAACVGNDGACTEKTGTAMKSSAKDLENPEIPPEGQIIAYVDGSFEVSLGRYAYGCVILTPDGEIIRKSGGGNDPEAAALRNVTGEMLGAMYVVKWCIEQGFTAVDIRYDYMGIEMWATGGWKAKNPLTQKYAEYMQRCSGKINITFQKIAAHTGNKYNEEADKLAKSAL